MPVPSTPVYPLINGQRADFSCIELMVFGVPRIFQGLESIDYSYTLKPAKLYGTSPAPIGRTRGKYESDGKLKLPLAEANVLIGQLAAIGQPQGFGFMEVSFDISVMYVTPDGQVINDTIKGARITKIGEAHKTGGEALMVDVDLDVMSVLPNGNLPYASFAR